MKTNKTIEQLFKDEQSTIVVPSRAEFRGIIDSVTNPLLDRNTHQKGTLSPFGIFILMSKNKLILASSVALLAIIVIIPTIRHGYVKNQPQPLSEVTITESTPSTITAGNTITQSANGSVSEDITADIVADLNQEDLLIQQEFTAEAIITDDSALLDDINT
jgi:hypothetical protein